MHMSSLRMQGLWIVPVGLGLAMLAALPAGARTDYPIAEGFLGYSRLNVDGGPSWQNANGFQASGTYNLHNNLGIVGDFGAQFRSAKSVPDFRESYTVLFGPRLSTRGSKTTGFVHGLLGTMTAQGGTSDGTGLAMGFGGGMEVKAGDRYSVRPFQVDYIPRRFNHQWDQSIRVGVGIAFR